MYLLKFWLISCTMSVLKWESSNVAPAHSHHPSPHPTRHPTPPHPTRPDPNPTQPNPPGSDQQEHQENAQTDENKLQAETNTINIALEQKTKQTHQPEIASEKHTKQAGQKSTRKAQASRQKWHQTQSEDELGIYKEVRALLASLFTLAPANANSVTRRRSGMNRTQL